ncbi:response regulator transcription factor [Neobacillus cucumis]|uniref:response regulator transcription factor n=1 Tax=Neobacillus cucumis TaxID=1740721 RepID=UPI002E237201|nr:response regulator [Neobacillus cucumis]MED4225583.1 response regulator [Neobacillus cucumis]
MFQVLVVDDEWHAVNGIESGVEWDKLGISTVHTAFSVRQAKEVFKQHSIDLLICDIEMPEENGLEMLAWVREHFSSTESIFLTCHADFSYAKKAIQLGSLDYILKPFRFKDLENAILKAINKIQEKKESLQYKGNYEHYHQLWLKYKPVLIERFWMDLLTYAIPSEAVQFQRILEEQNIPFNNIMKFLPVLFSVNRWNKDFSYREEKVMEYALRDVAEKFFITEDQQGQMVLIKRGILVYILPILDSDDKNKVKLSKDFQNYIEYCNQHLYCDISCYIGKPVTIQYMPEMFESLLAYDSENVSDTNKVLYFSVHKINIVPYSIPNMDGWMELLRQGSRRILLKEIDDFIESFKIKQGLNSGWLYKLFQNFLQIVYYVLKQKGLQAHQVFDREEMLEEATRSVSYLQKVMKNIIEKVMDSLEFVDKTQSTVDKVKVYISHNINCDLSRETIAKYVYLSPDHLTKIFKKETGLSISDYMIQEKMKVAKELLLKTDKSVKEIAMEIGYLNFSHFSKIFKQFTNMTPKDFRKINQN